MGTLITARVKVVGFVLIALLVAATVGCTDAPTLESTVAEEESCDPMEDVNCQPSPCAEGDEDCETTCEDCEQSECDEGTECDFDPTLSVTDRLFDTADLPEGLEWITRFDDTIGDDGVCNGPGLAEIAEVEDSAAATFAGVDGQITQLVIDYALGDDAATALDTTVAQAGCGSWTSEEGDRVFTVTVEDAPVIESTEAVARFAYTAQAAGQPDAPLVFISEIMFAAQDVVVGLSAFGRDAAAAGALVDDLVQEAVDRALRGEPAFPDEPTLAEWSAHQARPWRATQHQKTQIQYGTTLDDHANGLDQSVAILEDQVFLMGRYPEPTERADKVDRFVDFLIQQAEILAAQRDAEWAADRDTANAKAAEYTANVPEVTALTQELGIAPP